MATGKKEEKEQNQFLIADQIKKKILNLINKILRIEKNKLNFKNPYEKINVSKNIIKILENINYKNNLEKNFIIYEKYNYSAKSNNIFCDEKTESTGERSLIVVNKSSKFLGTLTDGDIRRNIIKGINLKTKINKIYKKNAIYLLEGRFNENK